ncbi:MAG TPA: protease pro-enzyme activation domain-containing protein [Thermoanaerobaculaceae bacterium]|nr:protease pro-enzyme activation domain-containing protein [Thermoanaerobaculaceae bacterium]
MRGRNLITVLVGLSIGAWATVGRAGPLQRVVNDADTVVLQGNVHPLARAEFDVGRTAASLPEERMILTLKISPEKRAALDRLLADQQDPSSPEYHHWLTPEEFGTRFGATQDEVALVTDWLRSHGFAIDEVGKGRTWVNFSGTASDVEAAFHTEIHDYVTDGVLHHANATDPSIPRALADLVGGVVSLHDFHASPASHQVRPETNVSNGSHWLSPADYGVIYDLNPLYNSGINGAGQSIAVVARCNIKLTDVQYFRTFFGLPANDPQFILNGTDPGIVNSAEEGEADLDGEWSGAVAPNATIKMVISKSTNTTGGETLSAQYIVNNNTAPILTMSFYLCEASMGNAANTFYNNMWSQGAAEGISEFVCSGDSGAAGCDKDTNTTATQGLGVNGDCTPPTSVCVGGTEFLDSPASTYWAAANGSGYVSALGLIPEEAWNESANVAGGTQLWSTGGGASAVYAKPSWQVAKGVPSDGVRDVPDVSLAAAGHNAYIVIQEHVQGSNTFNGTSGTSAATPSMAGIMALVLQKTGQRQGNPNPRLYQLAAAQFAGTGPSVFHDVTTGNNSVPGQNGYSCGTGYDLATGIGSVDGAALANNWAGGGGGGGGTVTIYSDGFEGSFPGQWQLLVSSAQGTDNTVGWGRSTYRAASGGASIWCAGGGSHAQPPGGNYLPNEGTFAVYGPFSLADATSATLDYDTWYNTESGYDFLYAMISTDGSNYHGLAGLSGSSGGWVHKTLNFADVSGVTSIGASQVWVAFIFISDSSTQMEGAYVDNAVIKKVTAAPSCTYSLGSSSQSFSSSGGSGSFTVIASSSSCAWTAASNNTSFLNVTSGSSGTGNGTVGFSVAANPGSARTGTITAAGQTFTVNQSAGGINYLYSRWLPAVIHKNGLNQAKYRSDVGVLNQAGQAADLEFIMHASDGPHTMTTTVGAHGQLLQTDIAAWLGVTTDSGALEVKSDQPFFLTGRTFNQAGANLTYGQDYVGETPSSLLAAGQSAYLLQLVENGAYRSNIGIANAGTSTASVTVTLYDGQGNQVWTDTRSYSAGQFYQYQQPFLPLGGTANGYAKVTVVSGNGIYVTGSLIDQNTNDPTTLYGQH